MGGKTVFHAYLYYIIEKFLLLVQLYLEAGIGYIHLDI